LPPGTGLCYVHATETQTAVRRPASVPSTPPKDWRLYSGDSTDAQGSVPVAGGLRRLLACCDTCPLGSWLRPGGLYATPHDRPCADADDLCSAASTEHDGARSCTCPGSCACGSSSSEASDSSAVA